MPECAVKEHEKMIPQHYTVCSDPASRLYIRRVPASSLRLQVRVMEEFKKLTGKLLKPRFGFNVWANPNGSIAML